MVLTIGGLEGGPWYARHSAFWNADGTVCVRTAGLRYVRLTVWELEYAIARAEAGQRGIVHEEMRGMGLLGETEKVVISIPRKGVIQASAHCQWRSTRPAKLGISRWKAILAGALKGHAEREARMAYDF